MSHRYHPYIEGLDETLMDCPLNCELEELKGGPAPLEVLFHQTAAPIQLQVQTRDVLLKPGMGKHGNILFPTPDGLEHGQTATWMWPWEIKAPQMHWVAFIDSWGLEMERLSLIHI